MEGVVELVMNDISIVIPCYNHAKDLQRTLEALVRQTRPAKEIVVVDDFSTDDPESVVKKFEGRLPISFLRLRHNHGAPYARNEGSRLTSATYIMFLDADAELVPDALESFATKLDEHPESDFAYSSFWWGKKRFVGQPFDVEALKIRNYITTSTLIRRSAFPGFDETLKKFQDWDLWLTMAQSGSHGIWIERELFRITPRKEGMSRWMPKIAYRIPWHILGFTPQEIRIYREAEAIIQKKHHLMTTIKLPIGNKNVIGQNMRSPYVAWVAVVVGVEAVSLLTIFTSLPNTVATLAAGFAVFVLAVKRPTIAMGVMMLELLIGSKGYLLQLGGWPSIFSLRIVLTAAFLLGWLVNFWKHGRFEELLSLFNGRRGYLFLFILIAFADLRGVIRGNIFVLSDANAWVDWALLFPVLDISWRYRARVRRDLIPILWVALFWLASKTVMLEYIFSHGFASISEPLYLWVRRTGVGEVTPVVANAFRIFIQSYVYAVAAWLVACSWWFAQKTDAVRRFWKQPAWWMMAACTTILGISLSRSFWIGVFVGFAVLCVLSFRREQLSMKESLKLFIGPITAKIAGILAIAVVLSVPVPPVNYASIAELFGSRADVSDASASSRWNLLPVLWSKIEEHPFLGSGFGATVTYTSNDPRVRAQHPDGMYTTYAFEWGWLDHWIKLGIFGIPLMAYLLYSLGIRLWKLDEPRWLRIGCVSSLIGLATLHVFTPYLNHPLGFLFFFVGEGVILSSRRADTPGQSSVSSPQVVRS